LKPSLAEDSMGLKNVGYFNDLFILTTKEDTRF
jgi:hypothetical protein